MIEGVDIIFIEVLGRKEPKMGMSTAWTKECISSAHMRRCPHALSIKWVDKGVGYPIDNPVYSVI